MLTKVAALALLSLAAAHGVVTSTTGPNGNKGAGFATIADLDRTQGGKKAQVDTTVFPKSKKRQQSNPCGKTAAGGQVNIQTELAKSEAAGLPNLGADGSAALNVFQINGDGAGPYTMLVSADGGSTWTNMAVTQNVPGSNGRTKAKTTDFALVGTVPAGTECKGGADGQTCIVLAKNPVGPFGSCAAFTQAGTTSTAATKNASARAVEEAMERRFELEDDAPVFAREMDWHDDPEELQFKKRIEDWRDDPEELVF